MGGLIVQCVLVSVLPLLGSLAASVLSIVAVVVSACLLVRLKRMLSFAERDELLPANRGDRLSLLQAFLCLFVLVGVVGILHHGTGLAVREHRRRCEHVDAAGGGHGDHRVGGRAHHATSIPRPSQGLSARDAGDPLVAAVFGEALGGWPVSS
ncbi:MAG: hypothetical protein ACLSGS_06320 [Adlercreutzia sp.]